MRIFEYIRKSKYHLPILAFVHGSMLTAIVSLLVMSSYEDSLYDQIVKNTVETEMNDKQKALSLLHKTHELLKPRLELFGGEEYINIRDTLFRSSDIQLIDAKGACGSYAHVLGRLLQRTGIAIRIAQMKCGKNWGCHILLEANVNGKFVALDALYDLAFEKEDGTLASFKEVGQNWEYFKLQVPSNYNYMYAYEDVRYTNWNKIPVVMPALKKILAVFIGSEIETLSIRSGVLNVYKTHMGMLVMFYVILAIFTFFIIRKQAEQNIA